MGYLLSKIDSIIIGLSLKLYRFSIVIEAPKFIVYLILMNLTPKYSWLLYIQGFLIGIFWGIKIQAFEHDVHNNYTFNLVEILCHALKHGTFWLEEFILTKLKILKINFWFNLKSYSDFDHIDNSFQGFFSLHGKWCANHHSGCQFDKYKK